MTVELKLGWATHRQVQYACRQWHYSRSVPVSKSVKISVRENGEFIGVLVFSPGATPNIGKPFGLSQTEICELTRIALTKHVSPVSRILSISLKLLKIKCPGLKLIVSYADLDQDHHGGVYQASNWLYIGPTRPDCYLKVNGKIEHRKSVYERYGTQSLQWIQTNVDSEAVRVPDSGKHKYVLPLDAGIRSELLTKVKPYPKRVGSKVHVASGNHPEEGSLKLTPTLHP